MSVPFQNTVMGRRFFEHTVPELVRQLTRLNDVLERLVDRLPPPASVPDPEPTAEPKERTGP